MTLSRSYSSSEVTKTYLMAPFAPQAVLGTAPGSCLVDYHHMPGAHRQYRRISELATMGCDTQSSASTEPSTTTTTTTTTTGKNAAAPAAAATVVHAPTGGGVSCSHCCTIGMREEVDADFSSSSSSSNDDESYSSTLAGTPASSTSYSLGLRSSSSSGGGSSNFFPSATRTIDFASFPFAPICRSNTSYNHHRGGNELTPVSFEELPFVDASLAFLISRSTTTATLSPGTSHAETTAATDEKVDQVPLMRPSISTDLPATALQPPLLQPSATQPVKPRTMTPCEHAESAGLLQMQSPHSTVLSTSLDVIGNPLLMLQEPQRVMHVWEGAQMPYKENHSAALPWASPSSPPSSSSSSSSSSQIEQPTVSYIASPSSSSRTPSASKEFVEYPVQTTKAPTAAVTSSYTILPGSPQLTTKDEQQQQQQARKSRVQSAWGKPRGKPRGLQQQQQQPMGNYSKEDRCYGPGKTMSATTTSTTPKSSKTNSSAVVACWENALLHLGVNHENLRLIERDSALHRQAALLALEVLLTDLQETGSAAFGL